MQISKSQWVPISVWENMLQYFLVFWCRMQKVEHWCNQSQCESKKPSFPLISAALRIWFTTKIESCIFILLGNHVTIHSFHNFYDFPQPLFYINLLMTWVWDFPWEYQCKVYLPIFDVQDFLFANLCKVDWWSFRSPSDNANRAKI